MVNLLLQASNVSSLQKREGRKPQKKSNNTDFGKGKKRIDNSYKLSSEARPFEVEVSSKIPSLFSLAVKLKPLLLFRKKRTLILRRTIRSCLRDAASLSSKPEELVEGFDKLQEEKKAFSRLFSIEEKIPDLRNLYSFIDYKGWFTTSVFRKLLRSSGASSQMRLFTFLTPLTRVRQLTAKTILLYTLRRLKKYYFPQEIFPRLLNSVKNFNFYTTVDDPKGLSFVCSGRVTRRQMASRYKYQVGATSKGTIESPLDYAQGVVPLKYGTAGVKVYFTQSI